MFTDADVIHRYTRADALADGNLVAIDTKIAAEAGIKWRIDITVGLWAELWPTDNEQRDLGQSLTGRLWDLLTLFRHQAKRCSGDRLAFELLVAKGQGEERLEVIAVCGPGDNGEPTITFMREDDQ